MIFKFIKHSDCNSKQLLQIGELKQQHWYYPLASQIEWMNKNLKNDDIHLIIQNETEFLAYLSLRTVNVILEDNDNFEIIGLGNVCTNIAYKGTGLGYAIIKLAEYFVLKEKSNFILLCKNNVKKFYEKCGLIEYTGEIILSKNIKDLHLFSFQPLSAKKIYIEELF